MIKKEVYNRLPLQEKMQLLNQVIQKKALWTKPTREEAEADAGGDGGWICDVRIEDDGSVRTYLKDHPEPMRIYPDAQVVAFTAVYKRLLTLVASNFNKQGLIGKIITLLYYKKNKSIATDWLKYIFEFYPALLNEENYSQPIKELRRVLTGKIEQPFVDAITLVIEFDAAYRYRFQDVFSELNQSSLGTLYHTRKEVKRLLEIAHTRELGQDETPVRWNNLKKMLGMILLVPSICEKVMYILRDINLNEIRFTDEDIYWTNQFGVYNYRGLSWDARKEENKIKYGGIIQ